MAIEGKLGFLGGGNMGAALVRGLVESGRAAAGDLAVAEKDAERGRRLAEQTGVRVVEAPGGLPRVDVLVVAVKPADVPAACREAAGSLAPGGLAITLAAGVRVATVAAALPPGAPVVRAMPNTPALIRAGATALAAGPHAGERHLELARKLFSAVGEVAVVKEELMDAVTAVSGSGPAYVFQLIQAMADGGVRLGLDRATALTLASHTVAGAARLLVDTGQHPALLTDQVASPGGTTITALHALERGGFRGLVMDAVEAAARRGEELGGD
jgi:pyrroline-5-carboxylate reductase